MTQDLAARYAGFRKSLATITPSGNVVVERITSLILADFPEVSGHFSRTGVVGATDAVDGYDWESMLHAAQLLAHLKPDVICWNGSKGGSIGFDADRDLCARVEAGTGARACTSTLAIVDAFAARGVQRFGLVTPYRAAYQQKIVTVYAREGLDCVAEAHADIADNLTFASVRPDWIRAATRKVAAARPDAIIFYCTNFAGAPLVAELERDTGLPIFDSVSAGVFQALRLMEIDPRRAPHWGSLFAEGR